MMQFCLQINSQGYIRSEWYINDSLVANTNDHTFIFSLKGIYNVRLEVFDTDDICTAVYSLFHFVDTPIDFCGELVLPDQNASECECMTEWDVDSTGGFVSKTNYRWVDRWGNKYCNISIAGNCEDNLPIKSIPVPNPPPPSCQAGYFNLYFVDQTIGGTLYSIPQNQRDIVCQVFADMSQLIIPAGSNITVNFKINAVYDPNSSALASAGSYNVFYPTVYNAISHGEVWNAINSGYNDPTLFDGLVNINLAKIFYTGYSNISSNPLPNQYDLYAVMQHELLHALGIASFINSYSGSTYFQNNLFTPFDGFLRTNGTNVISNIGPGINYSFNSLGNNCNALKFNNQGGQQSPINSYTTLSGGGTTFYNPSHFDDVCTNSIQMYVMHSSVSANQQKRMQQEEVNVLCRIGYIISGNYGTPNLLTNSGTSNPNQLAFNYCSATGASTHLAANHDVLLQPFVYYTTACTDQNPNGTYAINVLGNDVYPSGTTVVDVQILGTGTMLASTATGFNFTPTTEGIYQIQYRLLHTSGVYSNYAIVSIHVSGCTNFTCSDNCDVFVDPNSCNLLCNHEFQKQGSQASIASLPGPIGPLGTSQPSSPNYFEAWQNFMPSPDFLVYPFFQTTFNQGGSAGMFAGPYANNLGYVLSKESIGQCVEMFPNTNYILSFYSGRRASAPSTLPYQVKAHAINTGDIPLGSLNAEGTLSSFLTWTSTMPLSQNLYSTPVLPGNNSGWVQYVASFTPSQYQNFLFLYGQTADTTSSGNNYFHLDNIELIEDNFSAGADQTIQCQQSVQLSVDCMELTNLHYQWFQLDANGNPILPALSTDAPVTVTPNTTTSYRVQRYFSNLGDAGNNGYFVEGASSINGFDDVTIFVGPLNAGFTSSQTNANCAQFLFTSNYQNGAHLWNFGDGNTSTSMNPIHQFTGSGTYTITHTVTELGCTATNTQQITINLINYSFPQVAPICSGAVLSALPTASANGVTGTWSPALNNTSTTTYTFTPIAGQCALPTTMTIQVLPNTITPVFLQVAPICSGASLSSLPTISTNGINGNWSPAINNAATTTYTFTPVAGQCALPVTMTIQVLPNTIIPTFTQIPPSCYGVTLTPLPTVSLNGISGTWTPALNNTATTTYTFTPVAGQCALPTTMTIQVLSSSLIPTFAPIQPICVNTNYTLPTTSLNGFTGTWSPAFNSATAGTTNYTFTSNNGCQQTMSVSIIDCGNCNNALGTQLSGTITGTLPPGNYRVVGDLFINSVVNIQNCVLAIEPNLTINIGSSGHLLLTGSHLYGCYALWNGIVVQNQGQLAVSKSSQNTTLIEDAKVAVDVIAYSAEISANRIRIVETTFNKNKIGIRINGYPYSNPNTIFSLNANVFTRRTLTTNPASWPNTSTVIVPNPAATNFNFVNPRINPSNYPDANELPTLLPSGYLFISAGITSIGMSLKNVGLTSGAQHYSLNIGTPQDELPYVFDRMMYGIDASNSVVSVMHAYFQGAVSTNSAVGIRTNPSVNGTSFNGRLTVDGTSKPVQFYNLRRAVDVKNYSQLVVQNTRIRTNRTGPLTILNSNGELGVRYESILTHHVHVKNNAIHNVNFAVHALIGSPSNAITNINLDVTNNEIRHSIVGGSAGIYFDQGIQIEPALGAASGQFTSTLFRVGYNYIIGVRKAITVRNLIARRMEINYNTVDINESTALSTATGANYWGIRIDNVSSSSANNVLPAILGNVVNGNPTYYSNLQVRAIMLTNTNNFRISCNNIRNTGAGLYFNGACPNTVRQNTLTNHRFGWWLESATIGAQGAANLPAENVWAGTWNTFGGYATISNSTTRIKTYMSGTSSSIPNSVMRVRNTTTQNPNNSWARENSSNSPYTTGVGGLVIVTGPTPPACLVNSIGTPEEENLMIEMYEESYVASLEQTSVAFDSLAIQEASEAIKELSLYEQLDVKTELRDSSEVLEEFYTSREEENIGKLREMDKAIEEQNFSEAASLRDEIIANNGLENAYKTVLSLVLKHEEGTFTANDSTELVAWATSCSYLYGKVPSMAQSSYNCIYRESVLFDEFCNVGMQRSDKITSQGTTRATYFTLYPNPSKNQLFVLSHDEKIRAAACVIRSLDGRTMYEGTIDFELGLSLSNLTMVSGVYMIELYISETNETLHQQFVYLKE